MRYARIFRRVATLLSLLVLSVVTPTVHAQPPPLPEEVEEYPIITPEDPGAKEDPAIEAAKLPNTLGRDFEPSKIDPIYFDQPLPDGAPSPEVSATAITPIALLAGTPYFSYHNRLTVLVGVSADNACHLHLGNGDICRYNRDSAPSVKLYQPILADAQAKGLNKIRLWVSINGGNFVDPGIDCTLRKPHRDDQPFLYTENANPSLIGTWKLDRTARNAAFFDHLREVVQYARNLNPPIIVEVTFFAPWQAVWELGPWHKGHGRDAAGNAIGFSDRSYFVKIDTNPATKDQNEGMRQYQKMVIEWTVDALIGFDNVYWEIANEPEAQITKAPTCGPPTNQTIVGPKPQLALPADVAAWQADMINHLKQYEAAKLAAAGLTRPHIVAVQPFSPEGANLARDNPNIQVINAHYTTVARGNGGLGAITLVQMYASTMKAKGYNEGKISGILGSQGIYALDGLPAGSELTDVSRVRAVRAEAWEVMVGGGAAYDHYGYYYSSPVGAAAAASTPAVSQLAELSPPLTPAQVACDQAQLERLQARMVSSPIQGNLILWRSGGEGGAYRGVATTAGFFDRGTEGRFHREKQLAFDLTIDPGGDFLNPRRSLLPQALIARRTVASNLDEGSTPTLEATLDLAPTVPNQFLPQRPIRVDSRRTGSGAADGAGRGLAIDDLATSCHGQVTNFDLTMFEILSRTLRATACLAEPSICNPFDEFNFNVTLFRGESPGTYRANIYIYAQECEVRPCETSFVFARPEVEVMVEVDAEGRLQLGRARFLPFCRLPQIDCSDEGGAAPWAVYILPPIWAGHEVQGAEAFQRAGFLNLFFEGSSENVLTTTFDWSALLAGTAWSGPLR